VAIYICRVCRLHDLKCHSRSVLLTVGITSVGKRPRGPGLSPHGRQQRWECLDYISTCGSTFVQ